MTLNSNISLINPLLCITFFPVYSIEVQHTVQGRQSDQFVTVSKVSGILGILQYSIITHL